MKTLSNLNTLPLNPLKGTYGKAPFRGLGAILFIFLIPFACFGQLSLEQCYEMARENYPLIRQYDLIGQSEDYNLQNASRGYLPQFSLSAKATYQTEVVSFPLSLPGVDIPQLNKDQYQAVAEVRQLIWDGGAIQSRKQSVEAEHELERKKYETDIYALHERINELFFGILLIDEQLNLIELHKQELDRNRSKVLSYIENGTANRTDLDIVDVELLKVSQRRTELLSLQQAFSDMLSYFIGRPGGNTLALIKPSIPLIEQNDWTLRPEMALFDARVDLANAQKSGVTAANMPMLSLFVQGGYGNPGLNILKDGFRTYAIGGVNLSWNFGNLYTRKNNLRKIDNNIDRIRIEQDVFNFNMNIKTMQQQAEINKYADILSDDDKIIRLRENIRKASEAKVENGTMNINDLMRDIDAEQSARKDRSVHEIEMLKSAYQLKTTLNK